MAKEKIGKSRFLELLEKQPQYPEDGSPINNQEARTQWEEDIQQAFNEDVLGKYDEEEDLENRLLDLEEKLNRLQIDLKKHKHLLSGEAMKELG